MIIILLWTDKRYNIKVRSSKFNTASHALVTENVSKLQLQSAMINIMSLKRRYSMAQENKNKVHIVVVSLLKCVYKYQTMLYNIIFYI